MNDWGVEIWWATLTTIIKPMKIIIIDDHVINNIMILLKHTHVL